MPEKWRLLCDPPLPGEKNMARDLDILKEVSSGEAPPTLRLYGWAPPALSLGRFQKAEEVVNREACRRLGVDLVRRPTGGRAVLHHRELTYSIVVSESHPLIPGGVPEAYLLINRGILAAFALLNIEASLASAAKRGVGPSPGSCFDTASAYEVQVKGKKVVGSAQVRRDGALLQHGAILMELSPALYREVLLRREDNLAYSEALGEAAGGLNDLGFPVTLEEVKEAVIKGFSQTFSIEFM